ALIFTIHSDISQLAKFVIEIDRRINCFGLSIRKVVSELDNSQYYVLINIESQSPGGILFSCGEFTEPEKEFFNLLISEIINGCNDQFQLPMMDALNLTSEMKLKLTKNDANNAIEQLIQDKWLYENDGSIYIGPRTSAEFGDQIANKISTTTLKVCKVCKNLSLFVVFSFFNSQGRKCDSCNIRYHVKCFETLKAVKSDKLVKVCLGCSSALIVENGS
ncbi:MAG: Non-structural maintenance of chromosomes element 1, partial [Paramarteilia canceri]